MNQYESANDVEFSIIEAGHVCFDDDHHFSGAVFRLHTQTDFLSDELLPVLKNPRLTFIHWMFSLLLLVGLCWALPASALEAETDDLTRIAAQTKENSSEAFPVEFMNRHIFTVRSGFMGYTSEERAIGIRSRIKMAMDNSSWLVGLSIGGKTG